MTKAICYNYFNRLVERAGIESIPENYKFMADDVTIIKMQDGEMTVKNVSVRFMGPDLYKIYCQELPMNTYTLDQIKSRITKIKFSNEPKITPRLNREINPEDIFKAKRLVKNYGGFIEATGE